MGASSETLHDLAQELLKVTHELADDASNIAAAKSDDDYETLRLYLGGDCDEAERTLRRIRCAIPDARPEEAIA